MDVDFSGIGRLLSSPARSKMLAVLFDGEPQSSAALARSADIAPSTASEHLRALVEGGLVAVVPHGRRRDYQIAGPEIAEALEALGRVCPRGPVRSLRTSQDAARIGFARTCYDHLAGRVGVAVFDSLVDHGWLVVAGDVVDLGPHGGRFDEVGVDASAARHGRRCFARPCLDATERRPHLAGALGAALCTAVLDRRWFVRVLPGRGLRLTEHGAAQLPGVFGIDRSLLSPAVSPSAPR